MLPFSFLGVKKYPFSWIYQFTVVFQEIYQWFLIVISGSWLKFQDHSKNHFSKMQLSKKAVLNMIISLKYNNKFLLQIILTRNWKNVPLYTDNVTRPQWKWQEQGINTHWNFVLFQTLSIQPYKINDIVIESEQEIKKSWGLCITISR